MTLEVSQALRQASEPKPAVKEFADELTELGLTVTCAGDFIYVRDVRVLIILDNVEFDFWDDVTQVEYVDNNDLGKFYVTQVIYQRLMGYNSRTATQEQVVETIRRQFVYLIKEASELLDAFPWKWHRDYSVSRADEPDWNAGPDLENVVEEVMDIWIFALNVLIAVGVKYDDLINGTLNVHDKNFQRWRKKINASTA